MSFSLTLTLIHTHTHTLTHSLSNSLSVPPSPLPQMLSLPKLLESARLTLCASHPNSPPSSNRIPLYSWDDVRSMLPFIGNEDSLKMIIRSLHTIGAIVEVKWYEYKGDDLKERAYVVTDPKWLADLMKSVVTIGGSVVKCGVISKKQLLSLFSKQFQCDLETLIRLMCQLDVTVEMDEGERYLVPCMLADTKADNVTLKCKNPRWTFRRSYFISDGKSVPVGVMGKVIAISMRWGRVVSAWKDGCVVTRDDVWYSVRRNWVHIPKKRVGSVSFAPMTDGVHIVMSSNSDGSTSESRVSFVRFRQLISNVLCEFYHVTSSEVIPTDDDCDDWCTLDEMAAAIKEKNCVVTTHKGEQKRIDTLCCDLRADAVERDDIRVTQDAHKVDFPIGRYQIGCAITH